VVIVRRLFVVFIGGVPASIAEGGTGDGVVDQNEWNLPSPPQGSRPKSLAPLCVKARVVVWGGAGVRAVTCLKCRVSVAGGVLAGPRETIFRSRPECSYRGPTFCVSAVRTGSPVSISPRYFQGREKAPFFNTAAASLWLLPWGIGFP